MKYMKYTFTCVTFPLPTSSCPSSVILNKVNRSMALPLYFLHWWSLWTGQPSFGVWCGLPVCKGSSFSSLLLEMMRHICPGKALAGVLDHAWIAEVVSVSSSPHWTSVGVYCRRVLPWGEAHISFTKRICKFKTLLGCGYNCGYCTCHI